MAEANGYVTNQKKRRLPEWMSRISSSSEKRQTEADANEVLHPHPVPCLETTSSENFIVKEKELKSKKKPRTYYKDDSDSAIGCSKKSGLQKRPPKVDSKTERMAKKTTSNSEKYDDREPGYVSSGGNKDELELTVDDLISIAREYVKADEEAKRVGRGAQKSTSQSANPSSCCAVEQNSAGAFGIGVSESTSVSRGSPIMPKTEMNNTVHLELGSAATILSRSNDAAQDMLDLFLGPLLKKPDSGARNLETVSADDMVWSSADTGKHTSQTGVFLDPLLGKPDLRDWKSELAAADGIDWSGATSSKLAAIEADRKTEVVVMEKKKSSLKDKVTMLLD